MRKYHWYALLWVAFFSLGTVAANDTLTQAQVQQLERQCETARDKALAPIRAQKTQACVEQQQRSRRQCERYYATYGNVSIDPSGAPQQGLFYDLPPCRDWLAARKALRMHHAEP
ncbi:MAG: hypothetical protein KDI16_16205 [Halioglobus sp.]|nr:hypothetical protein [Halioglobus sp.]